MASRKTEYDFVERPSQDFFCPVSLELLLEPQLTSCCGHHLSIEAATRLQREGRACPMCNGEQWQYMIDKNHRRKVHEVRVRCWHKDNGCEWVGELNGLGQHAFSCENRLWKCEYCGLRYEFLEGEKKHWPTCATFPEPCPNSCEVVSVERCNMEQHRSVCPLEPLACEMKEFGCSVVVPRKELATHMKESELQHLTAMTMLNLRLTKQLQQDSTERDKKIAQLQEEKEKKIIELQQEVTAHKEKLAQTQNKITPPIGASGGWGEMIAQNKFTPAPAPIGASEGECELIVQNYLLLKDNTADCYSNSFYSHYCGYKFKLKIDFYEDDIAARLYLMKGEYDRQLHWPVTVSVRLELLNQIGDHHHVVKTNAIKWEKTEKGRDFEIEDNMIKYRRLEKNVGGICYVVNDSLKFQLCIHVV